MNQNPHEPSNFERQQEIQDKAEKLQLQQAEQRLEAAKRIIETPVVESTAMRSQTNMLPMN